MDKPLIQDGEQVHEMTNEEYAEYLKTINGIPQLTNPNE